MNILFTMNSLSVGGPTNFILRLSNSLSGKHDVFIYDHHPNDTRFDILKKDFPSITFIYFPFDTFLGKLAWLVSEAFNKIGVKYSIFEYCQLLYYRQKILKLGIEVVCSTHLHAASIDSKVILDLGIPLVIRHNGNWGFSNKELPQIDHVNKINAILDKTTVIIYTADHQFNFMLPYIKNRDKLITTKIMNGMLKTDTDKFVNKLQVHNSSEGLIFGMVSRGEKSKGWSELLSAFKTISGNIDKSIQLILVGESEYLTGLKIENESFKNIHFVGYSKNPMEWIAKFDVAVLPTYFEGECTPNTIIEYLSCEKPVISTNYVEIPQMISYKDDHAGILIDFDSNFKPNVDQLAKAMKNYLNNPSLIDKHSKLASLAFKKFDMNVCRDKFEDMFKQSLQKYN